MTKIRNQLEQSLGDCFAFLNKIQHMVLLRHVWEITPIMSFCLLLKPASFISCKFCCPKLNWFCTAKINSNRETGKKMFMWLRCTFIEFLIGWWDQKISSPASGGYNSPFSVHWHERFSSPPWNLSGLVYRWLIFLIFLISAVTS